MPAPPDGFRPGWTGVCITLVVAMVLAFSLSIGHAAKAGHWAGRQWNLNFQATGLEPMQAGPGGTTLPANAPGQPPQKGKGFCPT